MKKSKIFIATGAVILAVTAFLSSKANHRFTALTTAYGKVGTTSIVVTASSAIFTTVKGTLSTAILFSGTTKIATLFSTASLLTRVYYK